MIGGFIISFLDDPLVSSFVFYPRKIRIPDNLGPNVRILKFQITQDVLIGGFCYLKDPDIPTMLMFHGNGEIALDYINIYELFHECGVNLAVADFRGYGFSSGTPFYTSLIKDAMPIYTQFKDWVKDEGLKNSLFIMGRSLGSICASEIGSHNPSDVRGIFFESGFASIFNLMTRLFRVNGPNITPEALKEWSNDTRIAKIKKPVLIIHGSNDWIIPSTEAELIHETLPEEIDAKLHIIRGAGHNDILLFREKYTHPLKEFIKKYG
ncbi:MAG: alpha/beta hydrolase [Promethearchaeota archaeon]